MEIAFSIIIPVFNAESYIRACVMSILRQRHTRWEAIFVDDGSTDQSRRIIEEYMYSDSRIRLVRKRNEGVSAARNDGIQMAKYDWIAFVDADDCVEEGWLETANQVIESHCKVSLIHFQIVGERNPIGEKGCLSGARLYRWGLREFSRFGVLWLCIIRRNIIGELRLSPLSYKEDSMFLLELLPRLVECYASECQVYHYRMVSGSLSKRVVTFDHVVAYLSMCFKLYSRQVGYSEQLGCSDTLRSVLHSMCVSDVFQWLTTSDDYSYRRSIFVLKRFGNILKTCKLRGPWKRRKRDYCAFAIWRYSGSILGFRFVALGGWIRSRLKFVIKETKHANRIANR